MQEKKPLAYLSKALGPKALKLSTYEKELFAIVIAVEKWRPHLGNGKFIIRTDHQSLKYFMKRRIITLILQK